MRLVLVTMDITMPGMDGIETVCELKALGEAVGAKVNPQVGAPRRTRSRRQDP